MNKAKIDLSDIDTVILAGGLGTRLQPVLKDKPKCLAPINGRPFIDILLDNCIDQGLKKFILCVGYLRAQIVKHLSERRDCQITFSIEERPLGTAGAVKNAERHINSDDFFAMNGDSFIVFDVRELIKVKKNCIGSILLCNHNNVSNYGTVKTDRSGFVTSFLEKTGSTVPGFINAGRYVFNRRVLNYIPKNEAYSTEHELLPELIRKERISTYRTESKCVDIGTPARLEEAEEFFSNGSESGMNS